MSIIREPKTASASPASKRREQSGQFFRRVLAVAVDERDDVEAVIDGVAIAEFLVAAVTLVFRACAGR